MVSSKNTPTAAGQTAPDNHAVTDNSLIDAVNQMFAEFELVYHNQFQKAFANKDKLMYAKRLWLSHLSGFTATQILAAARKATHESEYLPTVRGVLKYLEDYRAMGLPDAREAYREACLAPSPKIEQPWSHPAVYLAGSSSDWFLLNSKSERETWPVFEKHYRELCERVVQGEKLQLPEMHALPAEIHTTMTPEQRQAAVAALRKSVDL